MSERNVVQEVVAKSLCCGCGVCAGVCPRGALEMRFNLSGELVPALLGACAQCGLCRKVCPALDVDEPLSPFELFGAAAGEAQDIGCFVEAFVGHSVRHRQKGASGGIATWTIEELLREGRIDAAVCVARSGKKDRLFEPVIVRSPSDLFACTSSKYYPVEFCSVLSHIVETEGRYAIVALPCVVTAIRKAQRALPVLRKRIQYVFALACGHGVSKHFTNFLLVVLGLDEATTRAVDFRYADRSRISSNFAFRAQRLDGEWSRPLFFDGLYGRLWAGRFFVPQACEFCGDLFGPLADATFMDAWLPEYTRDPRGTSIVIARRPELADLFRKGPRDRTCFLRTIDSEKIRRSQSAALAYKTAYLPLRVARARRDGLQIPRSLPCGSIPAVVKERLARIKHVAHDGLCRLTFDREGRARGLWVSVLTAHLRAQWLWRTARRAPRVIRERIKHLMSGQPYQKTVAITKKHRRHFLLVGHAGLWNRGCEAILETTFRLLTERFSQPTFTVVSFDWANDRFLAKAWENVSFRNVTPERWRSPHWYFRVARRLLHLGPSDWRAIHNHLCREYRKADAVLSVGGDNYTTDYSPFPAYYLDVLKYAREQNTKGVIWAGTVGPFDDPEIRRKVVEVLKDTPLITARESLTVQYLASIGIAENVRSVADPAFLLEPLSSPAALSYRIGEDRQFLGICASSMLWKYVSDQTERDRSDVLVKFIDWVVGETGFCVALIPHVVDTRPGAPPERNDYSFLTQIAQRVRRADRVVVVEGLLRAREIKHVVSGCRFFIGSRTHSTIAALSSGVPTISLSYSMKSRGINRDVLGTEDFALPVKELSLERLQRVFQNLMEREDEVRSILQQRIPLVKEHARKNAQYLAELLEADKGGMPNDGRET